MNSASSLPTSSVSASAASHEQPLRVAIIGSGMGGLSAAWLLTHGTNNNNNNNNNNTQDNRKNPRGIQVDLYESHPALGLGAHAVDLEVDGKPAVVDIPPRVFNRQFYTQLLSLYEHIEIPFHTSNAATTYLQMASPLLANNNGSNNTNGDGDNGANGANASSSTSSSSSPSSTAEDILFHFFNLFIGPFSVPMISPLAFLNKTSLRILIDLFRFQKSSRELFLKDGCKGKTLGKYLEEEKFSDEFTNKFLVPMLSVICTCTCESVKNYPLHDIVEFYLSLTLQGGGVKRSICGTREIVAKLSEGVDNIRLSCQVTGVWPQSEGGKSVCLEIGSSRIMYDHVIIATQANHAVKLLPRASNELKQALESIPYELTTVSLHRDTKLMPSNKSHWSPMNIFVSESGDGVMCTAWQNQIQPSLSSQDPVFQTWNPLVAPEPELHIATSHFQRPVVTLKTEEALKTLADYQGKDNIWFCGAYVLPGIPLLENAARSGLFAAESISGYKRPWSTPIVRTIGQQPHFFARLGKYVLYTAATASSGYMLYKYISKYNNGHEVFAPASSLLGYVRSYCGL